MTMPLKKKWLIFIYRPTSLFSLRMTHATNKGGKTLLVPTPYAVKMALIDACFRKYGAYEAERKAKEVFSLIKDKVIRFRPPVHCVVQNTFLKIKQEERGGTSGIYVPTIAYREFCYYAGDLEIAIDVESISSKDIETLVSLGTRINYFGKRGSFMQFYSSQILNDALPTGFTCTENNADLVSGNYVTTNYLDDFGDALIQDTDGFARINSYGGKPSALGKFRVLKRTLLPYRFITSGKHFTYYKRTS